MGATAGRGVGWIAPWVAAIVAVHVGLLGAAPLQFLIQFTLSSAALLLPGLIAWNLESRRVPRTPLRWQIVVLLCLASLMAALPWNSTTIGCPDC